MITILTTDPLLRRMLVLELARGGFEEGAAEEASVWLLDLTHAPRPLPQRGERVTVIGFSPTRTAHGVDVCLPLPYDTTELLDLLSHLEAASAPAPLRLRHLPRLLIVNDRQIPLSPAEDRVMRVLLASKGKLVSEQQLEEALLSDTPANVLQVHIYRLRKKLGAYGFSLIRTVRGKGYLLEVGEIG